MVSAPLSLPKRAVPIHVYTVERADGSHRRKVIPGGYCADVRGRVEAKLEPGERIVAKTWRSDWRFLDHPAGGGDYATTNIR